MPRTKQNVLLRDLVAQQIRNLLLTTAKEHDWVYAKRLAVGIILEAFNFTMIGDVPPTTSLREMCAAAGAEEGMGHVLKFMVQIGVAQHHEGWFVDQ
eukprot:1462997-Pyramimonas_sp.AAC.1